MSNATNSPALSRVEGLLDENSFVEIMSEVTSRSTDFNLTNEHRCNKILLFLTL